MDQLFDVAVIGSGPAGGSCALEASKLGLKTLVLEEHNAVGEPVHCGECLSDFAVQKIGGKLPPQAISKPVKGVRVVFPAGGSVVLNEPGFVLEKHEFEKWIADSAVAAGAEIRMGKRVEALTRNGNEWSIRTSDGSEVRSKILVDASGVAAVSSRLLNLNPRFDAVIGMQYEMHDIPETGFLDFYLWPKLAPEGYLWMIPKSGGRANVGLSTTDKSRAKVYLDEFVKKMGWQGKAVVKSFGGLIPASGPVQNTFADGLMLIGDAAGFTSPLFEGGSHLGIQSGKFAAQVATEAVEKNDFGVKTMSKYKSLWENEFPPYGRLLKGKKAFYSFTDGELDFICGALPKDVTDMGVAGKARIGLNILLGRPQLLARGAYPALKALEYSRARFYGW